MDTTTQITPESILSLERDINSFRGKLIALETLATQIDFQVYQSSDNSVFQFEDYNMNEGLELMHSILSRRTQFLNMKVGIKND